MINIIARTFSYIFVPVFINFYALIILLVVNPYAFGSESWQPKVPLILMIFMLTVGFPILTILLLYKLNFIKDLNLSDAKDRIIPYIANGIFYLWTYITIRSNFEIPSIFKAVVLGTIIANFMLFFVNNFTKASAHTTGMAGLVCFTCYITLFDHQDLYKTDSLVHLGYWSDLVLLNIVILCCGIVTGSRLYLKAHTVEQVLGGLFIGISSSLIAFKIWL